MGDPKVGFGNSETWTPFSPTGDQLSSDSLVAAILAGSKGGNDTASYFDQVNSVGQLYKQVADQGDAAWVQGQDDQGNPVHYVSMQDSSGETYYMKMAVEKLNVDDNGIVVPNGSTFTLNGVEFQGMAMITHTVGYSNFTCSQTSRQIGYLAAGTVPAKVILPYVWAGLKTLVQAVSKGIQALWNLATGGGQAAESVAAQAAEDGEEALVSEAGVEVEAGAVEAAGAAGIAAGTVFIAVAIVLAVVFIAISFILHNSYHAVRIWNITQYNMDWTYWFDTEAGSDEGQLISGPGVVKDGTIQPTTILGASAKSKIPGVQGVPHASYGDINVVSSHEYNGIGYVLQLTLKDKNTDAVVQTVTAYYDIPFTGDNSTNITFDPVNDLGQWYGGNQGNNKSVYAGAQSADGLVVASTSYDYLNGQHAVPSQLGGSSNEAYSYQSVLVVQEPQLKVSDIC